MAEASSTPGTKVRPAMFPTWSHLIANARRSSFFTRPFTETDSQTASRVAIPLSGDQVDNNAQPHVIRCYYGDQIHEAVQNATQVNDGVQSRTQVNGDDEITPVIDGARNGDSQVNDGSRDGFQVNDEVQGQVNDIEEGRSQSPSEVADGNTDAWVNVACIFFINAHTWGLVSAYGVFLAHYIKNQTFPGATALDFAFVGGLSIGMALLTAPVATLLTRHFGTRTTLFVGCFIQTCALLGAAFATKYSELLVTQGILLGFGLGLQFVGSFGIIPQCFTRHRSLANSIATSGFGIGGLIYSLAAAAMITNYGPRVTFVVLATISLWVNFIGAMYITITKIRSLQHAFDIKLFKSYEYILFTLWAVFSLLGYIVLLYSLPTYSLSIQLSTTQGSIVVAMIYLGQGIGSPLIGFLSDKFGRLNIATIATFLAGLFTFVIWIPSKTFGPLVFFALIVGLVAGTIWTVAAPIAAEVVGLKRLPAALLALWLVLVIPAVFSEAIGLQLSIGGTKFIHSQIFVGCVFFASAFCMWFLRASKIRELEEAGAEPFWGRPRAWKMRESEEAGGEPFWGRPLAPPPEAGMRRGSIMTELADRITADRITAARMKAARNYSSLGKRLFKWWSV